MIAKDQRSSTGSSRIDVGEIDTSAPFQSVKDAVSLFGEGAFSGEKPAIKKTKPQSSERFLAKETQLQWSQRDLEKLKDQLKIAEEMRAQALVELERARNTVDELKRKLNSVTESKNSAINATEVSTNQVKKRENANQENSCEFDGQISLERDQYVVMFTELASAKQELWKIYQERDASLKVKLVALNEADQAERLLKLNDERACELSKDIAGLRETIEQVKLATLGVQQEQVKVFSEKDGLRQSYKANLELSTKNLEEMKVEFNSEASQNLEKQLAETEKEVVSVQQQMESAKASDLSSVKTVTSELCSAKESLQKVVEEENNLRSLVESLKIELENAKKEHASVREKEAETEIIAGTLHVKLSKAKAELEAAVTEESKARGESEELIMALHQISLEAENARNEADIMKSRAEELRKEAEATQMSLQETEKKLVIALDEAAEAKIAEASALKSMSERTNVARASTSDDGASITMSREEFEALKRRVEESDSLAEMKAAAALAQVEAIKASENEAVTKLEMMNKEIEDMKAETAVAVKRAEMAEAAKRAVESELRRWREREQKRAEETASRILAESGLTSEPSPRHLSAHSQISSPQRLFEVRKLDKAKSSASKKQLLPNISGIFTRKKSQIESGSPSYLPGETPV